MRQLTEHQLRLLTLAASGMTHPEIAQVFRIDHKSVRYQLRRARLKLGAKNTTHAVYIAFCDKSRQEEEDKAMLIEEIMDRVKELMLNRLLSRELTGGVSMREGTGHEAY